MSAVVSTQENVRRSPIHLAFLDGLRAAAALYVLMFHVTLRCGGATGLTAILMRPFEFGHFAVTVFIVLSGYCLMLPVAKEGSLRGGLIGFIKRRARRIIPPYYCACVFSLLCILFVAVPRLLVTHKDTFGFLLSAPDLLLHLFLLQNLSMAWIGSINSAFWSVASEWQIYFVFALLLLPIWKRFGIWVALAASLLALLPHFLFKPSEHADMPCPWYIISFTLGMMGAVQTARHLSSEHREEPAPWGWFAAILVAIFIGAAMSGVLSSEWNFAPIPTVIVFADLWLSVATTALIVHCAVQNHSIIRSALSFRPLVAVGTFSYSLYLTHIPVLDLLAWYSGHTHRPVSVSSALQWLVGIPLAIGVAYVFHLAFERPFLVSRRQESAAETARDAALSPAP